MTEKSSTLSTNNDTAIIIEKTTDKNTLEMQVPTLQEVHSPFPLHKIDTVASNDTSYKLNVGDKITIKILGEDNLSNKYTIQNSGTVNMPLIGEITVAGYTLHQAEQHLFTKFTDGYLINPDITITVLTHRSFYILGEVQKPGRYHYMINMTVSQAVEKAGGFTSRADTKKGKILKNNQGHNSIYKDLLIEEKIDSGDIILIRKRGY